MGRYRNPDEYLLRYGYLSQLAEGYTSDDVARALISFQSFFRLSKTGEFGGETERVMDQARCAMPDDSDRGKAILTKCPQQTGGTPLKFAIIQGSASVPDDQAFAAIRAAVQTWSVPGQVPNGPTFQEVSPSSDPDIVIGWVQTDTDLGFTAGDYAHADFPPNCHASFTHPPPSPLHLNDRDFTWSVAPTPGDADVQSVVLHEFGHLLGMSHSSNPNSVMSPILLLGDQKLVLTDDDLQALLALYP